MPSASGDKTTLFQGDPSKFLTAPFFYQCEALVRGGKPCEKIFSSIADTEAHNKSDHGLRENFKYYFADFVRKGGGRGTPQIRNSLFAENFVRKGGEGGTPHIRNLFFGPKTGVFWAKNTIFSTF